MLTTKTMECAAMGGNQFAISLKSRPNWRRSKWPSSFAAAAP
jgi:hypothetical protein